MSREGNRKQRSDKKREVKPTLPLDVKDLIYRISNKTHTPVKDVCEYLTVMAMNDRRVLTDLSIYFQRNLKFENTIFFGSLKKRQIKKRVEGPRGTLSVKFKQRDYAFIYDICHALDCRPTIVVAILLQLAIRDKNIVEGYLRLKKNSPPQDYVEGKSIFELWMKLLLKINL